MRLPVLWLLFLLFGSVLVFAVDAPASYTAQCVPCHAVDGKGKTNGTFKGKIPDLGSRAVQGLSDDDIYETIARGAKHREYPHAFLYRGLKEKDIRELVKYIRTFASGAK